MKFSSSTFSGIMPDLCIHFSIISTAGEVEYFTIWWSFLTSSLDIIRKFCGIVRILSMFRKGDMPAEELELLNGIR